MARSQDYKRLIHAMAAIEQYTCIVFQKYIPDDSLDAKSYIWFDKEGEDMPLLGFSGGKQVILNNTGNNYNLHHLRFSWCCF